MLDDLRQERENKLERLADPYPARVRRTHTVAECQKRFGMLSFLKRPVAVVGRIHGLRDQGNIIFADLRDGTGDIQLVLQKKGLSNFAEFKAALDIGDFVAAEGVLFKTKKGEKSVRAKSAGITAKSLRPLPSDWYGLKDPEERMRRRYLDFALNGEQRWLLEARAEIISDLRGFLRAEGFLEVETPVLQPIPGGARAKPFKTHYNALGQDFYLRVAPELYLKRLLVGGFEKVFEIGKVFRNEGIDRDHNPEFTELELYWAYQDYEGLMGFVEKMLKRYIPGNWERISFAELFRKHAGKEWYEVPEAELDDIYKRKIRSAGAIERTTFVTDYPERIMALAKYKQDGNGGGNPSADGVNAPARRLTESFQLIPGHEYVKGGPELVKGFSEMNDPRLQRAQMEEQEARFRKGDEEEARLDKDFLEALEYGMPPAAGMGLGIDRLVLLAVRRRFKEKFGREPEEVNGVRDIIAFPTLRQKD